MARWLLKQSPRTVALGNRVMNNIFYIVGVVVVIAIILSFLGLR